MDKQKQIEEMAKIAKEAELSNNVTGLRTDFKIMTENAIVEYGCGRLNAMIALYNAGYRKIHENAVVLTREEYARHKGFSREEVEEISETATKNTRKETAEKFAERLKEKFAYDIERCKVVDEIAKEIENE